MSPHLAWRRRFHSGNSFSYWAEISGRSRRGLRWACPFQDVQELREFIEADGADEAADGGDAGIVLAGGESRHAVFFGIHAHTAEFVDREYLPVFGETVLLVEGGAAVSFDKETDDEHGDGEDDEGYEGEDDVDDALPEEVLR